MSKAIKLKLGGNEYWLLLNGDAYMEIIDKYGNDFIKEIADNTRDAYIKTVDMVVILAEQGEMARRFMGYDAQTILTADTIRLATSPLDIRLLKDKLIQAVNAGLKIDNKGKSGPIDLVLQELEKKTILG